MDIHDSSANNTVLEAIAYKTPLIVKKHPAIIEYLGKDYPLYFEDPNELNNNFITDEKIIECHKYLCNLDVTKFKYLTFNQELLYILNSL